MQTNPQIRSCNSHHFRIEQTPRGALITICGDAPEEVIADYTRLMVRLEQEGFKIAPEE